MKTLQNMKILKSCEKCLEQTYTKNNWKIISTKEKITVPENCKMHKNKNSANHDMIAEVWGKTAIEIINTLIKQKFISSLQHVGDMGIELCKAELALKYDLKYVQDKDLKIWFFNDFVMIFVHFCNLGLIWAVLRIFSSFWKLQRFKVDMNENFVLENLEKM